MVNIEAFKFAQEKMGNKAILTNREVLQLVDELIDHLKNEKCFDKLALHDKNCECWDGAWTCGCSRRRFGH